MVKELRKIEIVASTEPGLSSMGAKTRLQIQATLLKRYEHVAITIVNTIHDLNELVSRRPDLVFLGMKCLPSQPTLGLGDPDKIWLSEFLHEAGIAYTGSGHTAIELEMNKELAKARMLEAGVATSAYVVVRRGDALQPRDVTLTYPLFVKPTNRGGGTGVDEGSLVYTFDALQAKVIHLEQHLQADALIEEYLPGREFTVSLLRQQDSDDYLVMPLELVAPAATNGARFLSRYIKAADTEQYYPVASGLLHEAVCSLAMDAFRALGAHDYGRIDMRLDANEQPRFLEANLLPCLLDAYGNFPKACRLNADLPHAAIIENIVDLALSDGDPRVDALMLDVSMAPSPATAF